MVDLMKNEKTKGYLMVLSAGIMWGTMGLFTTMLSGYGLSSSCIAFLRLASCAAILGIMMLVLRGPEAFKINMKGLLWCTLLGVFSQALFNLSYTTAVKLDGMAVAAVLLYTAPVFACIMSKVFFRENISGKKVAGLAVNVLGCAFAVTGGSITGLSMPAGGVIAGFAAGFFYSTLTIISTAALRDYDPLTMTFYAMLIGSAVLCGVSEPWAVLPGVVDMKMLLIVAGFGLIPTCLAYVIYMEGLSRHLEASRVPVVASVEVVSSAMVGTLALSQDLSFGKVIGIGFIMLSIAIMNMNFRRPALRSMAKMIRPSLMKMRYR